MPTRIARADGKPMGIAGIWTGWRAPDGTIVRSMSMLTVNADEHPLMKNFHRPEDEKRMVVVLDEGDFDAWLDPGLSRPMEMMRCLPADTLVTSTGYRT